MTSNDLKDLVTPGQVSSHDSLAAADLESGERLEMKMPGRVCWAVLLIGLLALPGVAKKKREPLADMNFVVLKDDNGKPVRNAAVVLHPVDEDGKQKRNGLELKTDADGKANFEGVPYGKLRIQVLADGFQTYGEDYDVDRPSLDVTVKMKRPSKQYSIYEEHPEKKKPEEQEKKPE